MSFTNTTVFWLLVYVASPHSVVLWKGPASLSENMRLTVEVLRAASGSTDSLSKRCTSLSCATMHSASRVPNLVSSSFTWKSPSSLSGALMSAAQSTAFSLVSCPWLRLAFVAISVAVRSTASTETSTVNFIGSLP
jgi:hypothetical protein